jgi:hypothetical protein
VLLSNPWNFVGGIDLKQKLCCKRLRADLLEWYAEVGMHADRRLSDLTLSMLGDSAGYHGDEDIPHPGCGMKTKAAESGDLMVWAIALLDRHGQLVAHRDSLRRSGLALQSWIETLRDQPLVVPSSVQQQLNDCMLQHITHATRSGVHFVPKYIFSAIAHIEFVRKEMRKHIRPFWMKV